MPRACAGARSNSSPSNIRFLSAFSAGSTLSTSSAFPTLSVLSELSVFSLLTIAGGVGGGRLLSAHTVQLQRFDFASFDCAPFVPSWLDQGRRDRGNSDSNHRSLTRAARASPLTTHYSPSRRHAPLQFLKPIQHDVDLGLRQGTVSTVPESALFVRGFNPEAVRPRENVPKAEHHGYS